MCSYFNFHVLFLSFPTYKWLDLIIKIRVIPIVIISTMIYTHKNVSELSSVTLCKFNGILVVTFFKYFHSN